jgi:hypothetical protein
MVQSGPAASDNGDASLNNRMVDQLCPLLANLIGHDAGSDHGGICPEVEGKIVPYSEDA